MSQYASSEFRKLLKHHGIKQSMSRKGNCYDNAAYESFFKTIKRERIYQKVYRNYKEAKSCIFEYIEIYYNRIRKHSYLNYKSPIHFEIVNAD